VLKDEDLKQEYINNYKKSNVMERLVKLVYKKRNSAELTLSYVFRTFLNEKWKVLKFCTENSNFPSTSVTAKTISSIFCNGNGYDSSLTETECTVSLEVQ
jgi:hypothetical protein